MKTTIYLLTILLLIGCGTLEVGIENATAVSPSIKATKTSTIAQSATTKEPTRPVQAATVEPEPTPESIPQTALEMLVLSIQQELREQNYDALQALMTEEFIVGYWMQGWGLHKNEQAIIELQEFLPKGATVTFTDDDTELQPLFQTAHRLLDPNKNVVEMFHSMGWGNNGKGETIIFVTENEEGQPQWESFLYNPQGFDIDRSGKLGGEFPVLSYQGDGFIVTYPDGWTIGELDHVTLFIKEKIQFTIAHKDIGDETPLETPALPAGELIDLPAAGMLSQSVPKRAVVDDRKVKAVLYDEVTVGNKVFAFHIDGVWPVYNVINIKPDIQIEIEDMMRSIIMTNEIAKDPPTRLLEGYGPILTYRDEDIGFEIDYPASWHVSDTPPEIKQKTGNNSVVFTSFKPSIGGGEGLPDGASKIDLSAQRSGVSTLEEALEQREKETLTFGEVAILSSERITLNGGLNAERWTMESKFGQFDSTITAINGYTILVGGSGDEELVEQIIRSLRVIDSTS